MGDFVLCNGRMRVSDSKIAAIANVKIWVSDVPLKTVRTIALYNIEQEQKALYVEQRLSITLVNFAMRLGNTGKNNAAVKPR